jgi:hypothetical protein
MRNLAPQALADLDHLVGWLLDQGIAAAAADRTLAAGHFLGVCGRVYCLSHSVSGRYPVTA